MSLDLIVEARAFLPTGFQEVEIGIDLETGKIEAVKRNLPGSPRKRFRGRLLLPSGVDLHVHFRDPGSPKEEDFRTGTVGAAKGGVGTVLDMPNTNPIVDRGSRLEDKEERVGPKAAVDWGLWCTITPETRDAPKLLKRAVGTKLYLAPTTGMPAPPADMQVREWLGAAARAGRPVVVHAERVCASTPRSLREHEACRSEGGEREAVEALARAAPVGARLHVAHASAPGTLEAAATAGWSVAVTPHHLLLACDEGDLGTRGKMNPPLRTAATRQSLWEAFSQSRAPIVESDHAPHSPEEKSRKFAEAPAGVPGVETLMPLLLRRAKQGHVDVDLVVRACAQHPADFLGIPKGRIQAGFDADFLVVDAAEVRRVRAVDLASPCGWTPFEGWETLPIEAHYQRGQSLVEDYAFVGRPGWGRRIEVGARRPYTPVTSSPSPTPKGIARPRGAASG